MDSRDLINLLIAILPFIAAIIGIFIRVETAIARMKTDIAWLKQKALERRRYDTFHDHEGE